MKRNVWELELLASLWDMQGGLCVNKTTTFYTSNVILFASQKHMVIDEPVEFEK